MKYPKLQEESLKIKVARDFFGNFDCTDIIGKIDFTVKGTGERYFLWGEAKADVTNICEMLTQLILTIGKARTFDKITPPPYIGCFDREKIAFIPYHAVQEVFYQSDFNWKVTPSNRNTREFKEVHEKVKSILYAGSSGKTYLFDFVKDEKTLKQFIAENFVIGKSDTSKIRIDKNNFISIYNRWLEVVKPTIAVDWELAKKAGIIDGDFYRADLLSRENHTLKEKLFVLLRSSHYELDRKVDAEGFFSSRQAHFTDGQKAHHQFWTTYERPPLEEYWEYIIERRDLLVPQDIRERKGSFFTPRIWVELSQKYIADVLGKDWQDEYYVWDCAAGTGNLLVGLVNKYNIWASTIDKADVDVMHDRIANGANLLKDHVFQFDFLNDGFDKLPEDLRDIINDENKRRKLVIYINPPYAEGGSSRQMRKTGQYKKGIEQNKIHDKYHSQLAGANREIFAQFLVRIYCEISGCTIANFSKLKTLTGSHFSEFRSSFKAKLKRLFVCPANTFDNVSGQFPIGFFVWDTSEQQKSKKLKSDIFDSNGNYVGKRFFYSLEKSAYFSQWVNLLKKDSGQKLGWLEGLTRSGIQHSGIIVILNEKNQMAVPRGMAIYDKNLMGCCIAFAVRKVIEHTWLNDRDQFLYPNDGWKSDREFRNNCFTYTLFNNNIQSKHGINHWIPFTEEEVNAQSKFKSNFMTDFIAGKIERTNGDLFTNGKKGKKLIFSREAKAVFNAGRKLWQYYHSQKKTNVNASLYDIREHFQGRNANGKMNNKSNDETYNALIADLRSALKTLALKIEPKVYEYGFLKK